MNVIRCIAASILTCVYAFSFAAAAQAEDLSMSLAAAPIVPYANSTVAAAKGYFKDAGLSLDRKVIPASDVIRSALASGEVDVVAMSLDAVLRAHLAGFGWQILYPAVVYDPRTPDAYLIARKDLELNSPKDLEGKIIALSSGTIADVGAKAWLRQRGVDISKLRIVEVPLPQMVAALESKQVDAGHMVYPGVSLALDRGIGKIVGPDLDAIGGRFLVSTYVAKGSWIAANPEKARRFVDAMNRATQFIIDQPAEALPIISKETRLDPQLAAKFFPSRYVAATKVPIGEMQNVVEFLLRERFIDKDIDANAILSPYFPLAR